MAPLQGLATMIGVFVGGLSGGLMSGILTGIPGTPSSVATTCVPSEACTFCTRILPTLTERRVTTQAFTTPLAVSTLAGIPVR